MAKEALQAGDPREVGPYRLLWRLGRGGMGRVYVGRSRGGRTVAVKVVHPEFAGDAQFRRRFAQEVAAARKVGGFYTAQVVDADPEADQPWLATAYVPGPSLYEAVEAHGPLEGAALSALGAGLAEALMAIHQAGLLHRDLKPENIILAADGPRVIDFGISRALEAAHVSTTVIGTPGFMCPEQAQGLETGTAADVFSLGAVLAYAASGRRPFGDGKPEAVVFRIVHREPELDAVPEGLRELVRLCLDKESSRRPGVEHVLDRLAAQSVTSESAARTWTPAAVTLMINERERELSAEARTWRTTTDASRTTVALPDGGQRAADVPPTQVDDGVLLPATRRPGLTRRSVIAAAGLGAAAVIGVPVGLALSAGSRSGATGADGRTTSAPATAGRSATPLQPQGPVTLFDTGGAQLRWTAFHPSGAHLASVGDGGVVRLWETATWQPSKTFTHQAVDPWNAPLTQVDSFNRLFEAAVSVAFSPDGTGLAVANGDGTVSLWNLAQGSEVVLPYLEPTEWNGVVASVAFHPNGGTLAATYDAAALRIWDTSDHSVVADSATGGGYWIAQLAYSPTGGVLASASGNGNPDNGTGDGLLQLWDPASGSRIATLADTNSPAGQLLAFSPDGRTLANVRSDGRTTLWDVSAQSALATVTDPGSGASCVVYGPNGLLATGAADGTVTVWSAGTRGSLAELSTGTGGRVNCIAFSPDGRHLAATTSRLDVWTL